MDADNKVIQPAIDDDSDYICLICQSAIEINEPKKICPSCKRAYHIECWEQNRGCAVYGCLEVPPTEPLKELEIFPSYWGKENKTCPSCGNEILAAALRCKHCGAVFASANPMDCADFHEEQRLKNKKSKLQKAVIWIIILCVCTLTAPIGSLIGIFWYVLKKKNLKSLPHIYQGMFKIGLVFGIGQTLLLIFFVIIFLIFR
jgi:hypothetical protein